METIKQKIDTSFKTHGKDAGVTNVMAYPKIEKVVLSSGTGKAADKKRNELVIDRMSRLSGQKAVIRKAKKSIATFKLREGDPIGVSVTLRGALMCAFLDKLIHIALPRMRDFKGLDAKSIDSMGNLTIGINEHTIFPEVGDEDVRDVFGFSVTVVTSAKDKASAEQYLRAIGFPFKKPEIDKA